ncbi:hypothetical protein MVEN_01662700 [Mycena venus]|uniref:Uncharacterized protein n=1 Tax=Mycena venus TaxID=2733690 RepID=A0A8H6XQP5_9AGAR|nr:hypothetical protein MVEN_01662700 [Mycena venus]
MAAVFVTNAVATGGTLPPNFSTFVDDVASVQETVPSATSNPTGSSAGSQTVGVLSSVLLSLSHSITGLTYLFRINNFLDLIPIF